MYSRSNREITLVKVKTAATIADIDDRVILERAIALVKENSPECRDMIEQLTATVQSLFGRRHVLGRVDGLMIYRDRPKAIAKKVLGELRYKQ